jgi:hypothetical protein
LFPRYIETLHHSPSAIEWKNYIPIKPVLPGDIDDYDNPDPDNNNSSSALMTPTM